MFQFGSKVMYWSSNKQATVGLSSTEAEYVAATSATCEDIWLRKILEDIQVKTKSQQFSFVITCLQWQ